jgi:hypothetical protein
MKEIRIMDWTDFSGSTQDYITHCMPIIKEGRHPMVIVIEDKITRISHADEAMGAVILDVQVVSIKTGELYLTCSRFLKPYKFNVEKDLLDVMCNLHHSVNFILKALQLKVVSGIEEPKHDDRFASLAYYMNVGFSDKESQILADRVDKLMAQHIHEQFIKNLLNPVYVINTNPIFQFESDYVLPKMRMPHMYIGCILPQLSRKSINGVKLGYRWMTNFEESERHIYEDTIKATGYKDSMYISAKCLKLCDPNYGGSLVVKSDIGDLSSFWKTFNILSSGYNWIIDSASEEEIKVINVLITKDNTNFIVDDFGNIFSKVKMRDEVTNLLSEAIDEIARYNKIAVDIIGGDK